VARRPPPDSAASEGGTPRMTIVRRGIVVVLFMGLVWACVEFIRRNAELVEVDLLATTIEGVVLWKLLASVLGIGAGLAVLMMAFGTLRARMETRRYRKAVRELESEVHQLRNLPLDRGAEVAGEPILAATSGGSGGG
jgi:uncharacterized membrane protein YciS (DUF1049 family)